MLEHTETNDGRLNEYTNIFTKNTNNSQKKEQIVRRQSPYSLPRSHLETWKNEGYLGKKFNAASSSGELLGATLHLTMTLLSYMEMATLNTDRCCLVQTNSWVESCTHLFPLECVATKVLIDGGGWLREKRRCSRPMSAANHVSHPLIQACQTHGLWARSSPCRPHLPWPHKGKKKILICHDMARDAIRFDTPALISSLKSFLCISPFLLIWKRHLNYPTSSSKSQNSGPHPF